MNKLLVTGLSLGKGFDTCEVCGMDITWLLKYPSILAWADKILIPKSIWNDVIKERIYSPEKEAINKSVKLIFEYAESEKIIEIVDPLNVIDSNLSDQISKQIEGDRNHLLKIFPELVSLGDDEKVPGQIFINGKEYCYPYMWTIYASLLLSKIWDAQCLFGEETLNFCKYKFGLSNLNPIREIEKLSAFQSVFEAYLPNENLLPEYITTNRELCEKCGKEQTCKDTYLLAVENNMKETLRLRDYDEVYQLKSVVNDIVQKTSKSGGIIDANDIRREFVETQNKLRRRMKFIFPKIKRWSNITTIVSTPIALTGIATGIPLVTITGATLIALSVAANKTIDVLSSKYSWTGFTNKDVTLSQQYK